MSVSANPIDNLTRAFKQLSLNTNHYSHLQIPPCSNGYFVRFKSTHACRDRLHLGANGRIHAEIISERMRFLEQQGMLKNAIRFKSRCVYANLHLFDISKDTMMGIKNIIRLTNKERPIAFDEEILVIHHIDQCDSGDWVVLTDQFHKVHDAKLHSQLTTSDPVNRKRFSREANAFWSYLSEMLVSQQRLDLARSTFFKP